MSYQPQRIVEPTINDIHKSLLESKIKTKRTTSIKSLSIYLKRIYHSIAFDIIDGYHGIDKISCSNSKNVKRVSIENAFPFNRRYMERNRMKYE